LVVLFRRGGEVLRVPASLLPPHELAFALTVHKSQGSEYDNVLLVLPSTGAHQLLTREIVYTAITRSRGMVAIWSFPQVLAEAVLRRIRRSSALGLWPEPEP
jgi:exodeoxyribonuclease V alpha subunit